MRNAARSASSATWNLLLAIALSCGGGGFFFGFSGIFFARQVALPPFAFFCFIILLAHISLHCECISIVYGTMMVHLKWFNIYLSVALLLGLACGCQSAEKKKKRELATLRLHVETSSHGLQHSQVASIFRDSPFDVTVEQTPFLTEGNVAEAKVINTVGGFAISIQFNNEGKLLLEQYTSANYGRKIAVFCQFGKDMVHHRWLAAPAISKRITNGLFVFTPDASREEAEEIVLGLNNVSKKLRGNWMHDQ